EAGLPLDARSGAIIMGINRLMEENKYGAFCDLLEKAFPKTHAVYALKCGDGYRDDTDECPDDPEDFDDFADEDGC
ncbi:MAG: hypothetical protein ABMA64_12820, partial [Myxococcota bacterium]